MKFISLIALLFFAGEKSIPNVPVDRVDLKKYSGTWYSLYSIPTMFDKGSRKTTGKYTWNKKGYFDVVTTAQDSESGTSKTVNSKVFPVPGTNNSQLKAQFVWPIKIDYWIIELATDYSYVVVGHPDHKFLFIMSRKKTIEPTLYNAIVSRCKQKGYDVSKLASQMHDK